GERVVEADAFSAAEQIDLPLHALVRHITAGQVEAEAQAENLVAEADGDERPLLVEELDDRRPQVADLGVVHGTGATGAGTPHHEVVAFEGVRLVEATYRH